MTGRTGADGQAWRPHFAQAFVPSRQERTLDGQPRTRRRSTPSGPCPVPTRADKRLCMLTSLPQQPMQEGQGQRLGMSQSTANTWIHVRPAV